MATIENEEDRLRAENARLTELIEKYEAFIRRLEEAVEAGTIGPADKPKGGLNPP